MSDKKIKGGIDIVYVIPTSKQWNDFSKYEWRWPWAAFENKTASAKLLWKTGSFYKCMHKLLSDISTKAMPLIKIVAYILSNCVLS